MGGGGGGGGGGGDSTQNVCFDFLYKVCLKKFLTVRRSERRKTKNVYWSSVKCRYSPQTVGKNTQISKATELHSVGAEVCHVDGRTDGNGKANSRFSQFRTRRTAHAGSCRPLHCHRGAATNGELSAVLHTLQ